MPFNQNFMNTDLPTDTKVDLLDTFKFLFYVQLI